MAAVHVVKGAAVTALKLKTGGTTEAVKATEGLRGRLTLNSVPAFPSKPERSALQRLVEEKVAEDAAFQVFTLPRSEAEELYGRAMYASAPSSLPATAEPLRLVSLANWDLSAHSLPVLRSTGLLGRLELTGFKHKIDRGQFEISFKVHVPAQAGETALATALNGLPAAPALCELIPDGPEAQAAAARATVVLPTRSTAMMPYPRQGASADSAEATYWAWFRQALGCRLRASLGSEASLPGSADGLRELCEARGLLLSEAELRHLEHAPVSEAWIRQTLEMADASS